MATASQKRAQPRGIRNHNPGNIELGKDKWQGLAAVQDDGRFAKFKDPTWGIRALAIILINYQDKYNISTIAKIINRWAPKVENDTESYIREVCEDTGFTRNEKLDMHDYRDLRPVVEAIIRHENGRGPKSNINTWYDDATIKAGLQRAGVVEPVAVEAKVPVTKETVGATATATLGAAQVADVAPQVIAAMESSQDHLASGSIVRLVIGIATIGLAVFIAYSQVKKHQEGVVA
nr:MAG TPA: virion protein [Caudoviricetes sp.]